MRNLSAILVFLAGTALASVHTSTSAAAAECAGLTGMAPDGAAILEATETAADGDVPSHCHVRGTIDETIGFEMLLPQPDAWNGKFNGVGNGALAGFINTESMTSALKRGYATASTDTGHVGKPVPGAPPFPGFDASWARDPGTGALNMKALENFGHRGTHLMTVVAKQIVETYYGRKPDYSYFTGCSGGGQQGLAEAQRYPDDYDGIVSGAPANHPMSMWPGEIYPATLAREIDIPKLTEKLPMITAASVAQCDETDGVKDGLIGDPRSCDFDATSLQCKEGADETACLTAKEAEIVNLTYEGFKNPITGEQFWPGFERGSESQWAGHLNPFFIQLGYLAYMVYKDPDWDFAKFDIRKREDFETVTAANKILSPMLEAIDPKLKPFADSGGKLIMWHGWDDQNIAPRNSVNYVDSVRSAMGDEADGMLRFFLLPGLQHCRGGAGFTEFDTLAALEDWVENGEAPQTLRAVSPEKSLTRDICAYPAETIYESGDVADPSSYACK